VQTSAVLRYQLNLENDTVEMFENTLLRRVFRPKREEAAGDWRKLREEAHHILHSPPDIIRMMKSRSVGWSGHVTCMGESRNAEKVLVGKPERMRLFERPGYRWKYN
jgi:hypothetical protein